MRQIDWWKRLHYYTNEENKMVQRIDQCVNNTEILFLIFHFIARYWRWIFCCEVKPKSNSNFFSIPSSKTINKNFFSGCSLFIWVDFDGIYSVWQYSCQIRFFWFDFASSVLSQLLSWKWCRSFIRNLCAFVYAIIMFLLWF